MLTPRALALELAIFLTAQISSSSAEPVTKNVPQKTMFVVEVKQLQPISGTNAQTVAVLERTVDQVKVKADGEATETAEIKLEASAAREAAVESRAQQIEAMNGGALLRGGRAPGGETPGGGGAIQGAFSFLLPRGKPLLSKNPNARRYPLRILEE